MLRLSGPAAGAALVALAGRGLPAPRRAVLAVLADPETGEKLDRGLVLWFPGPTSYTGEDVAELHVHGSPAVVSGLMAALGRLAGLRPAEPGEFTRRAFDHGKLDLTAVEGLADLIAAETAAQRRQALRQMDGALARLYEGWRGDLIHLMARVEADIDFPDEDLPAGLVGLVRGRLPGLIGAMAAHLADDRRGELLRDGYRIAIIGAPNVGKSSLLNALAKREAAIVAATAGTTRDVIEVHLDLAGYPAILADTAGLRATSDAIEGEGVRRARARAAAADLKIALFDASAAPIADPETAGLVDDETLVAVNKTDLALPPATLLGRPALALSVTTGQGLDRLVREIEARIARRLDSGGAAAAPALSRERHRRGLRDCVLALERAQSAELPELLAEDLRLAARALGRITGLVDVEDILDAMFRDFCIGK